ncbi:multicopper oxidase family protein [Dyella humicola]|uniref:multicopper oxidase family protein n=1 Tax=Dyella humicola TaxID=2992126 RepID=UPI00224F7668|nr:multicopper oxidase domain-containing protein [Dyella humicola]
MPPSRRTFLKGMAWGAAAGILPISWRASAAPMHMPMRANGTAGLCKHPVADQTGVPRLLDPARLTPFVDPLPVPPVLRPAPGATLRIAMQESEQRLHRELAPTRLWTYGGSMPGPTIEAHSGQVLRVEWANRLPTRHFLPVDHNICGAEADQPEVRAVVHVHGARVPAADDGYPTDWFVPGKSRQQTYPNKQDAATLWYHDHTMGIERLNLYAGMLGMYLLRDEHELSLGLPSGECELPLVLCDRLLTEDGQLYYPVSGVSDAPWVPEVFGNAMLVNGALLPRLDVQARRYRFRVLNAANGRFFRLSLRGQRPFLQIGSDQGLLAAPVRQTSLFLGPGERADLVLDFADLAGGQVELMNDALPLMRFNVAAGKVDDTSRVPAVLRDVPRTAESKAVLTRQLTIDEYADCTSEPMLMLLDGKHWHDPVSEKPRLGSTEIWSFLNLTEDTHPIHLHLVRFQILDRRPFDVDVYLESKTLQYLGPAQPPAPHEAGWKDTAQVYPGMVTRYIITFEGYAGRYVWHCHLLEHASNEMMRPFEVLPA